jgi:hypothetical protein
MIKYNLHKAILKLYLYTFLFLLCAACISLIYDGCNIKKSNSFTIIHSDTLHVVDTFIQVNIQADSFFYEKIIIDTFYPEIDTNKIINDYLFTQSAYYHNYIDTNYNLSIYDTIYQNTIVGRQIDLEIYSKTKIITNTVIIKPIWAINGGVAIQSNSISPILLYERNKHMFGIGLNVDFVNNQRNLKLMYAHKLYTKY